jgi:hypothetical protein
MTRERDTFDMFNPETRRRFGDEAQVRGNDSVRSDLVDLTLNLMAEKPLAIAVTDPAKVCHGFIWLPRSQIEFVAKGKGMVEVTLPSWLAKEKGLL